MKVLNKHKDNIPSDAIYVGRPSKWGNPYEIGKDGTREGVIVKYTYWLAKMMLDNQLNLSELRGKDLVCWCAPLPCHADVLLELANSEVALKWVIDYIKQNKLDCVSARDDVLEKQAKAWKALESMAKEDRNEGIIQ